MYLVISHATNQTSDPSLLVYMEYNACQKMYFDKDVVRSLVDMGMKEARAKWASHFLHDQSFAADRHAIAEFFVPTFLVWPAIFSASALDIFNSGFRLNSLLDFLQK